MTDSRHHRRTETLEFYLPEEDPTQGQMFPGPQPIPESLFLEVTRMVELSKGHPESDFSLNLDGIIFRVHRMPTFNGTILVCRQIPDRIWPLKDCGAPEAINQALLAERLNGGGLVLIAGKPGSGKSVTTAAVIKERLELFGGICITVEDPVEMPLQGQHGRGYCLQRTVSSQEAYAVAVRDAMRAYPTQVNSILMIGEVRDAETASLAIRASIDGRLVLTTLHAGDPVQAIYRMLSLASDALGDREARDMLASGLRLVLHQRLKQDRLYTSALFDTQQVGSIIRNQKVTLETLRNELANQQNKLKIGDEIVLAKHSS